MMFPFALLQFWECAPATDLLFEFTSRSQGGIHLQSFSTESKRDEGYAGSSTQLCQWTSLNSLVTLHHMSRQPQCLIVSAALGIYRRCTRIPRRKVSSVCSLLSCFTEIIRSLLVLCLNLLFHFSHKVFSCPKLQIKKLNAKGQANSPVSFYSPWKKPQTVQRAIHLILR